LTTLTLGSIEVLDVLERSGLPLEPIGPLCETIWHPVQNQARSNFKRIYTEPEHGVPFVSSRSMFGFPLRPERHLARTMKKLSDLMVPEGWLVISRSGTVGNVLYVNSSLAACAISDHAIRIEPRDVNAGYLYAFLASAYGRLLVARRTYGATVDELEPKHIAEIPLPRLGSVAESRIGKSVVTAYKLRDEANALLAGVEADLYRVLAIEPFRPADVEYLGGPASPRAFSTTSALLTSRLDATNYLPIARSVVHKLERGRYPLVQLGSRVSDIYIAPRFARIYVGSEHGTPFLQGSQMPLIRPYGLKHISNMRTDRMERWTLEPGCVMVTRSGTIGRVAVSTAAQAGWAASEHILRIVPRDGQTHPGFVWAFLSTPYGQHQLRSKIYGGVVDELTEDDTASLFIPDVPFKRQTPLGDVVLAAYEMRDKAQRLEDAAIGQLEKAVHDAAETGP
jgi:type I restriction enzyme, S subunit